MLTSPPDVVGLFLQRLAAALPLDVIMGEGYVKERPGHIGTDGCLCPRSPAFPQVYGTTTGASEERRPQNVVRQVCTASQRSNPQRISNVICVSQTLPKCVCHIVSHLHMPDATSYCSKDHSFNICGHSSKKQQIRQMWSYSI